MFSRLFSLLFQNIKNVKNTGNTAAAYRPIDRYKYTASLAVLLMINTACSNPSPMKETNQSAHPKVQVSEFAPSKYDEKTKAFENLYTNIELGYQKPGEEETKDWKKGFKIMWAKMTTKEKVYQFPYERMNIASFETPKTDLNQTTKPRIFWLGHSSILFQIGSIHILMDPIFSKRASPISWAGPSRITPEVVSVEDLPPIDIVLTSHSHYDHLDLPTIEKLAKQTTQPLFLAGLGLKEWMMDRGVASDKIITFNWGEQIEYEEENQKTTLTFLPAQHWAKRSLFERNNHLWGSWLIETKPQSENEKPYRFYFAGDTAYAPHFKKIKEVFGEIDMAALPVGAYEPRKSFIKQHMNPEDAVRASVDLAAKHSFGIHWATFNMGFEDQNNTPIALKNAMQKHQQDLTKFSLPVQGTELKSQP